MKRKTKHDLVHVLDLKYFLALIWCLCFFIVTLPCTAYADKLCNDLSGSAWYDCWDKFAEQSLTELNNKLDWMRYYRTCTVIKNMYVRNSHPDRIECQQEYATKQNRDNHQAYQDFMKFLYRSCAMRIPSYSGGMGRSAGYAMCVYDLTSAYIAYLEKFDFPQGWEDYYAEYLLLSPELRDIEHCLVEIKPGYITQKATEHT